MNSGVGPATFVLGLVILTLAVVIHLALPNNSLSINALKWAENKCVNNGGIAQIRPDSPFRPTRVICQNTATFERLKDDDEK